MRRWLLLASVFLGASLGACLGPQPVPMPLPPVRYQQQGFSFVPFDEPGWLIAVQEPAQITLGRHGANPDDTFVIQGFAAPLPEGQSFDSVVEELSRGAGPEGRYGAATSSVEPAPANGEKCVRSHVAAKDYEAVKNSANPDPMLMEIWLVVCPAPGDPASFVLLGYSTRCYESTRDAQSDAKAAALLDSFRLSAQPGGG